MRYLEPLAAPVYQHLETPLDAWGSGLTAQYSGRADESLILKQLSVFFQWKGRKPSKGPIV